MQPNKEVFDEISRVGQSAHDLGQVLRSTSEFSQIKSDRFIATMTQGLASMLQIINDLFINP